MIAATTGGGAKTGFQDLPAPKRIILVPIASDDAAGQAYIGDKLDSGLALQVGTFVAAQQKNKNLSSWNPQGPVWGAPDGCGYVFVLNNAKEPWNNRDVRLALNYAINRQEIATIGYEGSTHPEVLPFSGYLGSRWITPSLQAIIDKYQRDKTDLSLVDKYMTTAGYAKNADGKWAKGGPGTEGAGARGDRLRPARAAARRATPQGRLRRDGEHRASWLDGPRTTTC